MKAYINSLSLNKRLIILFSVIAICSSLNYLILNYFNSTSKSDVAVIDLVGKLSVVSQKIGLYSKMAISGDEASGELLGQEITQFEKSLSILKNGGTVPSIYGTKEIPPPSPGALTQITHIEEFWPELKRNLQMILEQPVYSESDRKDTLYRTTAKVRLLSPAIMQAGNFIQYNSPELLSRSNELIEFFVSESNKKQKSMNHLILGLLAINILIVTAGFGYVKNTFLKPINLIAERAVKINEGDLNTSIDFKDSNEIGTVSNAINKLVEGMKNAREFIKNIGQGNLDVEYKGLDTENVNNSESISGALLEMREQMRKVSNEEKERNWATEGLASFVEILRSNNDNLASLSDNIISNLVNYINANQGGIFILNDESTNDVHLELIACYAFETKKYINKKINIGEGLVGQAYRENRTIYLTDIPDDYIQITSGLGGANPKSILIVPLKVNDISHGVIELASFFQFEPYQIDFVKKLGESIASTISTVKINERTKRLLEESQLLTQAMQAQEETMRGSLEELMATQEEMQRKEMEITGQLSAINNTLATVQFSMDGYVLNANAIFLKLMGYSDEEIKGKHHKHFCDKAFTTSSEYEYFWNELKEGRSQTSDYKRITKEGGEVWITATYTPVLGADGVPYKIIKLAIDITQQKIKNIDYQGQLEAINKSNAVMEFEINGKIIGANAQFLKLLGYEEAELVGRSHRILVPEDERRSESYTEFWEQLKEGIFETGEFRHLNKDGREIWIRGSYNPIMDINGTPYKVVQFAQDITREKLLEVETINKLEEIQAIEEELRQNMEELTSTQEELGRRLKESEEKEIKLKTALNNIYEGIVTTNKDGNVESVNHAALRLFGFVPEEILGKPINMLLPDVNSITLNSDEGIISASHDHSGKSFETMGRKKDGTLLFLEVGITSSKFEDKKIITLILRDISETKKTEEKLKNFFLVCQPGRLVLIADQQGKIEWVNEVFEEKTGYSSAEALQKDFFQLLSGEEGEQKVIEKIKKLMSKKESFTEQVVQLNKKGERFSVMLSINPVLKGNGEIERFIMLEEILEYAS